MNALAWRPPVRFVEEPRGADDGSSDGGTHDGGDTKEYVAFTDDEEEEREYAEEHTPYSGKECPLCDVQQAGSSAASSHVTQIMSLESGSFGSVPDLRTFDDIAKLYNDEVVVPNARSGRKLRPWTRLNVKNHFDRCRVVPRRRAAQVLRRAHNIMSLTYSKVKHRDIKTGEIGIDHKHANNYFNQASKYMQFLKDYRALTGADANGLIESNTGGKGVKRAPVVDTQTGSVENGLLYHFSERRLMG